MQTWTDEKVEAVIGGILRAGVIVAAFVTFVGGILYLFRHGTSVPDYRVFRGEPGDLRRISGIVGDVRAGSSRGLIQLGVVLLLATPVVRVAFSAFAFARQRDWVYVGITLTVLGLLLFSLSGGRA
jgi:uncharacterized membrane protein